MRFPKIRKNICENCLHKCDSFLNNEINFNSPASECPLKVWHRILIEGVIPDNPLENIIKNYATWKELHERALNHNDSDDSEWLFKNFTPRIKSFGCSCKRDWAIYLNNNKPDWNNYFEWTWRAHQAVNIKIGKPQITLDEARKIWLAI